MIVVRDVCATFTLALRQRRRSRGQTEVAVHGGESDAGCLRGSRNCRTVRPNLMRCRHPFDESEREFAARTTSQARTQAIGNLLCGYSTPRFRGAFRGRVDELTIGHAVAETDVHARVRRPLGRTDCKWE